MSKKSAKKPARQRPPMESMMSFGASTTPKGMQMGPTGSLRSNPDPKSQFNSMQTHESNFEGSDLRQQMSGSEGGGRNLFGRKKKREKEAGGHKSRSVLARRRGSR